jgi:hypothetical protein
MSKAPVTKDELMADIVKYLREYKSEMKENRISQGYWESRTELPKDSWQHHFKSWLQCRREAVARETEFVPSSGLTRDSIEKKRKAQTGKTYIVSCVIPNSPIRLDFVESMKTYCKKNNAELVLLGTRGVNLKQDVYYAEEAGLIADHMVTEFVFNRNLKAGDFRIAPNMMRPLASLDFFVQRDASLIIASPKQHYRSVPTGISSKTPRALMSTGTICEPYYPNNRVGIIAKRNNTIGALIVEVKDNKEFFVRPIQSESGDGSFADLGVRYHSDGTTSDEAVEAMIVGDYHVGWNDKNATDCLFDMAKTLKPNKVYFHDFYDMASVSHHNEHNMMAKVKLPKNLSTLESELRLGAEELEKWNKEVPETALNIVASNHSPDHLNRYLTECRYAHDKPENHRLALELAIDMLDGKNPIESWTKKNYPEIKVNYLTRDNDIRLSKKKILVSSHGDKGNNGAKGSMTAMQKAYGNSVIGHMHSPAVENGVVVVGTLVKAGNIPYTEGSASGWQHTHCIIYADGSYQLISSLEQNWRGKTSPKAELKKVS